MVPGDKCTYRQAAMVHRIVSAIEFSMSLRSLRRIGELGESVLVSSRGIEQDIIDALEKAAKEGHCLLVHVNRRSGKWVPISESRQDLLDPKHGWVPVSESPWDKLGLYDRVVLYPDALGNIRTRDPISFYISDYTREPLSRPESDYNNHLSIEGVFGPRKMPVLVYRKTEDAAMRRKLEHADEELYSLEREIGRLQRTKNGRKKVLKTLEQQERRTKREIAALDRKIEMSTKAAELLRTMQSQEKA